MQSAPMTEISGPARPLRRVAITVWLIWVLALVLRVAALVFLPPVRAYTNPTPIHARLQLGDLLDFLSGLVMTTFGVLIVLRSASRRYGWLMLGTGFSLAINTFVIGYHQYALLVAPEARLPLGPLAAWVYDLYMIPMALGFFCLPVLFPDGKLPSRRWRWVFWPTLAGWSISTLVIAFAEHPVSYAELYEKFGVVVPNPFGFIPYFPIIILQVLLAVLLPISILTGLTSLIARYGSASGEVRQQIKWVVYFLVLWLASLAAFYVDNLWLRSAPGIELERDKYIFAVQNLLFTGVWAALGIAVLKYRLYAIDLLINRTLVYGGLTAAIIGLYVLVVGALGALFQARGSPLLAVLATGLAALLFQPLRLRLQRAVNRLMYGERDEPYHVLTRLGQRLEAAIEPKSTLPLTVETVACALKLPYVGVTLQHNGTVQTAAAYGAAHNDLTHLPLIYAGETIGELVVASRAPDESLTAADWQLLSDLARQIGVAAHAALLAADLERARLRIVAAREEARRRLGSDLHDSVGHQLTALARRAETTIHLLDHDPAVARESLAEIVQSLNATIAQVRGLAHQLHPPELELLGLVGVLRECAQTHPRLIIRLDAPETLAPLPSAVETVAYYIALEALTNVEKHAGARSCYIRIALVRSASVFDLSMLEMDITDDGCGLPPLQADGLGLLSMQARAAEVGGVCRIESGFQRGTIVSVRLPCPMQPSPEVSQPVEEQ